MLIIQKAMATVRFTPLRNTSIELLIKLLARKQQSTSIRSRQRRTTNHHKREQNQKRFLVSVTINCLSTILNELHKLLSSQNINNTKNTLKGHIETHDAHNADDVVGCGAEGLQQFDVVAADLQVHGDEFEYNEAANDAKEVCVEDDVDGCFLPACEL